MDTAVYSTQLFQIPTINNNNKAKLNYVNLYGYSFASVYRVRTVFYTYQNDNIESIKQLTNNFLKKPSNLKKVMRTIKK